MTASAALGPAQPEQPEHDGRGVVQDQARPGWAGSQHNQLSGRGLVDEFQAGELEVDLADIGRQGRYRAFQQVNGIQVRPA
jgi:hypothetical protein